MENRTDYGGGRVNVQTAPTNVTTGPPHQYQAPDGLFTDAINYKLRNRQQQQMALQQPQQQAPQMQMQAPQMQERQQPQQDDLSRQIQAQALKDAQTTPRSLGRFMMNHTGNWGTMVDPADIPASLQGTVMGGFYGQAGNWDTSNPSITGPQQWATGKYTKNASGAGSSQHITFPGRG